MLKIKIRMTIPIYQLDAFASNRFSGNPAAVCPLEDWLPDNMLLGIAAENNLSETAFLVPSGKDILIRWFTPVSEVDLCGHATLASAYVVKHFMKMEGAVIPFVSPRSGSLPVTIHENSFTLDFPSDSIRPSENLPEFENAFHKIPLEVFQGNSDYLLIFEKEDDIVQLSPDFNLLSRIKTRGFIASAKGKHVDFVSRFFAPAYGINEDPVTGSAHTTLVPFWAERLGKHSLQALQLSERGGALSCEVKGNRTLISGNVVLYMKGEIFL